MPARYDVFLSYRRADTALVLPLRDELRRLGYRVFFDTQSIEGGENWKRRLERSVAESRALVLCWTESASKSEVVTFEYSCAKALGKTVVPWLLDGTPLPVMLNHINGIPNPDAVQVAEALRPTLGLGLAVRRRLQAAGAAVLVAVLAVAVWWAMRPAPPWEFQGEVIDPVTRLGIAGVEVDVTPDQGKMVPVKTDADGRFAVTLPQPSPPQTKYVHLEFKKDGYQGDTANVPAGKAFREDLAKVK